MKISSLKWTILVCLTFLVLVALSLTTSIAYSEPSGDYYVYIPFLINHQAPSQTLLISEVMYDVSDEPEEEWVEIYNSGSSTIDLADYKIGDEETMGNSEGMMQFPSGAEIDPGEAIVIANQGASFFGKYGFYPDYEIHDTIPEIPDMLVYAVWGGTNMQLSNTGDEVLLLDGSDDLADSVSWGSSTWAFDPSAKDVSEGHSLERYPVTWDTNSANDWRDQETPDPGHVDSSVPEPTPTPKPTPTSAPPPILVINEILADPAADISGDANGDGIRDGADDEFIEIINTANHPIDISWWTLSDVTKVRHSFPGGTVLQPGCGIVVFGGGNPNGDFGSCILQIASKGSLGLNNSGDTITLYDVRGRIIDTVSYGSDAGKNQSITRYPDVVGLFVKHSEADGSGAALFSPGTKLDATKFSGCQE